MKRQYGFLILVLICLALLTVACSGPMPPKKVIIIQEPVQGQPPQGGAQIANPASVNCDNKGGTLTIVKRGDGGEYGICTFTDNLQCEEWAMFRGDCPVGGIKVTGYVTTAAVYCAITGGDYNVTGQSNTEQEQGTCTFKNGKSCDVWDYWNGKCSTEQ
jgi:putative hemolysin